MVHFDKSRVNAHDTNAKERRSVDGSEQRGVPNSGGHLIITHAVCPNQGLMDNIELIFQSVTKDAPSATHCQEIMDKESKKVKAVEEKYNKLMEENGIPGEFIVLHGKDAWHDVISHQEKSNALMIVMGTRGQGALQRTFRGSVSDSVVHHATCPVIVCCHPKHHH